MKNISLIISFLLVQSCVNFIITKENMQPLLSTIAQELANNTYSVNYSMKTSEGYNMDCLKIIYREDKSKIGVFHSSKGQQDSYNRLYATLQIKQSEKYNIIAKLSDRGSQGSIFTTQILNGGFLIIYELENHQHGNTYAIRYYENYERLKINNFLYQYQLEQKIDSKLVRNIGTPSIDSINLTFRQYEPKYNQYKVKVKFHYSPDGSHDYPGYGEINLNPLRDFVDKNGNWVGGVKQSYTGWKGYSDTNVLNAMRKIGVNGKIGQRDSFQLNVEGKIYRYYLYQANLESNFDWRNWRIFLYGQTQNQAILIPFVLDKVVDMANPHVTIESNNGSQITLQLSFFLPSEGMQPSSNATPGQVMVKSMIKV